MTEARNSDCIHFKVCKYSGCSQRHCDDYLTPHSSAKSDAVLEELVKLKGYMEAWKHANLDLTEIERGENIVLDMYTPYLEKIITKFRQQ